MKLNELQKAVLRDYAAGDYADLADMDEIRDDIIEDPLLAFLLAELADEAGCVDASEGITRLETARDELDVALEALVHLEEALRLKLLEKVA